MAIEAEKSVIREANRAIIAAAASQLVDRGLQPCQANTQPLPGLFGPQIRSGRFYPEHVLIVCPDSQQISVFVTSNEPVIVAYRIFDLSYPDEATVVVTATLYTDPKHEGYGLGGALFDNSELILVASLAALGADGKELVYIVSDGAHGADPVKQAGDGYRQGWTSAQVESKGFAMIDDIQNLCGLLDGDTIGKLSHPTFIKTLTV